MVPPWLAEVTPVVLVTPVKLVAPVNLAAPEHPAAVARLVTLMPLETR